MNKLFLRYYAWHENLIVNKQLVPFRGRCSFKHYLPSKPDKYGMKFFWISDSSTFYSLTAKPYLRKQVNVLKRGLSQLSLIYPRHLTIVKETLSRIITSRICLLQSISCKMDSLLSELKERTRHLLLQTFFNLVGVKYTHRVLAFKKI